MNNESSQSSQTRINGIVVLFWILVCYLILTYATVQQRIVDSYEYDIDVLQNRLDSSTINYERSLDDFRNVLNEYQLELTEEKKVNQDLQYQLENIQQELNNKIKEVKDLNAENSKLKRTASTVGVGSYSFNTGEMDLFYRLVEAEAGGESIEGRIAVANVILNRIRSPKYPDTLKEVIYQQNQFEVVTIGTIDTKIPSEGTKEAVRRAINGENVVPKDTVIFWAKYVSQDHPIWQHNTVVATIGVHHFSRGWE